MTLNQKSIIYYDLQNALQTLKKERQIKQVIRKTEYEVSALDTTISMLEQYLQETSYDEVEEII